MRESLEKYKPLYGIAPNCSLCVTQVLTFTGGHDERYMDRISRVALIHRQLRSVCPVQEKEDCTSNSDQSHE